MVQMGCPPVDELVEWSTPQLPACFLKSKHGIKWLTNEYEKEK